MKDISLNFGAIRDTVYRYASKEIISEGNTKETILTKFLNEIKSNPHFKIQYFIYKNLEEGKCKDNRLADRYIAQNLKLLDNLSWQNIMESNKKIRLSLLNGGHVQGNIGKDDLYENINIIIESASKRGFFDVTRAEQAHDFIVSHLLENYEQSLIKKEDTIKESNDYPKLFSWKYITSMAVNNFNKRYSHLNENEKSLLKILLSSEDKKINYLQDLKNENIAYIEKALSTNIEDETASILEGFKSKINSMTSDNIDESIIHCYELKDTLEEIVN